MGQHGWWRSRRPLWLALAVSAAVLVLVVVAALMLKDSLGPSKVGISTLSLHHILQGTFTPRRFNGSWVSESEILYRDLRNNAVLYNVFSLTGRTLTTNYHVIPTTSSSVDYVLSADRHFLLAVHNRTKVFGQPALAQYEIIDVHRQTSRPLEQSGHASDRHLLQYVTWLPRNNDLVFVYKNDLYYRPSTLLDIELRLTHTGVEGVVFNGITDFIYGESVLKSESATYPSPNGKRLAFVTFNDSGIVPSYVPLYGPAGRLDFQYPRHVQMRYPKAGTVNPRVIVSIVDLEYQLQRRLSTLYAPVPRSMAREDVLLTGVAWMNNDELATVWMNRIQTYGIITVFNYDNGDRYDILRIEADVGWLDPIAAPMFSTEFRRMILVTPQDQGDGDGKYNHVTLVQLSRGRALVKPLTSGKFSVTELVAWDTRHNIIYFLANDMGYQHLYSVSDDQWSAPNAVTCITCEMRTNLQRMPCLYNTAVFNSNFSFYMLNCAGPDIPEITIYDKSHTRVAVWDGHQELRAALLQVMDLPTKQYLQVPLEDGSMCQVQLTLPLDYNPKRNTQYPLLVHVNDQPGRTIITEKFFVDWNTYLSANRSIIVARIMGPTDPATHKYHRKLGFLDVEVQLHVTRYLQDNFRFIDRQRTAIWGSQYGGYVVGMTLVKDTFNVFKCGIAISPITEWLYHESVWTERYMGLPTIEDNLSGYIDAGLTNKVENLRNKRFLLMHGTMDNAVHYQHSVMLAMVLQQQDIPFVYQSYPDVDVLTGARPHAYHLMESFLDDCFK
ncbi:venom dipeptidyl peptidase 4 isoform X2 [Anabrus simplex]|uniref:venom dipeptidyl peptidase 4 isoform X2 n=1 Tax=Anabrus simplex TaxID=316456 RepID=UPI0035A37C72